METMTITNRYLVADIEEPKSDTERELLQKRLAALLEREFEKALFGGWPPGYQPGKGFPGTYYIDGPPRCCRGVFLHEPNCPVGRCLT